MTKLDLNPASEIGRIAKWDLRRGYAEHYARCVGQGLFRPPSPITPVDDKGWDIWSVLDPETCAALAERVSANTKDIGPEALGRDRLERLFRLMFAPPLSV